MTTIQTGSLPDATWRRNFRRRLLTWFSRHARDLPWRQTRDPYAIWVSEIMLQQTQVATVIPYFQKFIRAFPTIQDLAAAAEEQVLRHWEGLGYYRRARQLWRAAKVVVSQYEGKFPRESTVVRSLPGIGRYTAGAILSIAFDERQPILEANTVRFFSRVVAYRGTTSSREGQELLWRFAEEVLPRVRAGDFNQSAMELGSVICTPRQPKCDQCPVRSLCVAHIRGWQEKIPAAARRPNYADVREACVVVRRRDQVLLRRCEEGERWAGLWDFPRFPLVAPQARAVDEQLVDNVQRLTGIVVDSAQRLITIKHGVTRFRITLDCFEAMWRRGNVPSDNAQWVRPAMLNDYPLSMTARKIARLLVTQERNLTTTGVAGVPVPVGRPGN